MKILLCAINYAPELTGAGKYNAEMMEWLSAKGHQVRVVTAPPYYPEWKVAEGYHGWQYSREVIGAVEVWRCPLWVPGHLTGLRRIVHLISFSISALPMLIRQAAWRPDVIISIEPTLFAAPATLVLARITRAHAWLHIQDFEIDAAFELGILSRPWLRRMVLRAEQFLLRQFDRVSTISPRMQQRLDVKGVQRKKQIMFPNWSDVESIFPLQRPSIYRQRLRLKPDQQVVLYAGNMGEKQGLDMVVELARKFQGETGVCFVMCGEGSAAEDLKRQSHDLDNMLWLPLQPLESLNELLNLADIHILPQREGAADLVMPSKLTGMLASGRPVLATAKPNTQIADVLSESGVTVAPGDINALSAALSNLLRDKKLRQRLAQGARSYAVNNLGKEKVLARFEAELLACITDQSQG